MTKLILETIRHYEIEQIKPFMKANASVLELGGGGGYQAKQIAGWGCRVESIDVAERPTPFKQNYPVHIYDGVHIPFTDKSFDVVFSSNVLEHIHSPSSISQEIRRVLKPEGIAIHILPSSVWRFWTLLTHYPNLVISRFRKNDPASFGETSHAMATRRSLTQRLINILIPPAHGEYSNSFVELYAYNHWRWAAFFKDNGFLIHQMLPVRLFYTGHLVLLNLSMSWRHSLSKLLGSSGTIFVLKKGQG